MKTNFTTLHVAAKEKVTCEANKPAEKACDGNCHNTHDAETK